MLKPADILLLDEPTNDLDIPTLEVLEESLSEFPGAIVLITHDRFLLDRLSDKLLYLDGQGKAEFFADYAQWRQAMQKPASKPAAVIVEKSEPVNRKKLSYEEQKELSRLPGKIQKAEAELEALQSQLAAPAVMNDSSRLTHCANKLRRLKSKWSVSIPAGRNWNRENNPIFRLEVKRNYYFNWARLFTLNRLFLFTVEIFCYRHIQMLP